MESQKASLAELESGMVVARVWGGGGENRERLIKSYQLPVIR